jgi:hypothetical protein
MNVGYYPASMREIEVRDKVRELAVVHPDWAEIVRVGNLTKLRRERDGAFRHVNYESGLLLYALVAHHRPDRILEIGTGRGFASLCMARALVDHGLPGRIITVDVLDADLAVDWAIDEGQGPRVERRSRREVWNAHFAPAVLERIETRVGDSRTALPRLESEGFRPDLVYIDADHTYSAVSHDFFSCLRLAARPFRMLLDDYTPRSHLYGVRRLVDRLLAPVFDAELIFTEGRWTAAPGAPRLDQGQVLIDSGRTHGTLEGAYSPAAVSARLFAYRRFPGLCDRMDQVVSRITARA